MKIVIVNGQNHKGSTRMIARELADKVGGETTEFFLPRDFGEPCIGCWNCFKTDMTHCPHYEQYKGTVLVLCHALCAQALCKTGA